MSDKARNVALDWIVVQKRKWIATIVLCLVAAGTCYLAEQDWFEDYDIAIKSHRDIFRNPEISQDVVIIGIDDKTVKNIGPFPLRRSHMANIVDSLNKAGVERLFFSIYFISWNGDHHDVAFEEALKNSSAKVFLPVAVNDQIDGTRIRVSSNERLSKHAKEVSGSVFYTEARAVSGIPFRSDRVGPDYLAFAAEIAGVDGKSPEEIPMDYAFDWKSLPAHSFVDVLDGKVGSEQLKGKTAIIGYYTYLYDNQFNGSSGEPIPSTAAQSIAANVLMNGRPYVVPYYVPILIVLFFVLALVWLAEPKWGAIISLSAIPLAFLITLLLETQFIYPENFSAYVLFIASAAYQQTASYLKRLDNAKKLDLEKSQFLARASHDLRQPIHAIGLLTARLNDTKLTAEQTELLSKVEGSVDSASRLFQSLLDLSIIGSGGLKPEYEPISISSLFKDLEKQNSTAAEQADISFRVIPAKHAIMADRILLLTILQNLISNAIKYAPGKKVLLGCRRRNDKISIWVCDNGIGIGEADLASITNEFYRSSHQGNDNVQGEGLGLSITKSLAELMKLEVSISSEIDQGTIVEIGNFQATKHAAQTIERTVNAAPQPLSGMQILLIDDDLGSLRATEALLQNWGCKVQAYSSFPKEPGNCDIVISDFDFGSGRTLANHLERINEMGRNGVSTIVVSGVENQIVESAMKTADLDILSKPVRPAELRSLLMSHKMGVL